MDSFTCITCRLVFPDIDGQREHYRTAWHCFNLKRKVAGLAPVSEELFNEKVEALKSEKEKSASQKPSRPVNARKKHKVKREKQRRLYDGSSETQVAKFVIDHVEPAAQPEAEPEPQPQMTEEEMIEERLRNAKPIPINVSLFDNKEHKDLESNLEYMRENFGLFIPEVECLTDLEGLIAYLGEKVGIGFTCLYCQKEFSSATAVQNHMIDKGHCKIDFYGKEEEFDDHYDWSLSPYLQMQETTEEQTDAEGKQIVVSTLEAIPAAGARVDETSGELVLKSGATIGHRSLQIYYKQRRKPAETRSSVLINKLVREYRTLGYLPTKPNEVDPRSRAFMDKYRLKLQTKTNKTPKVIKHSTWMT